MYICYKYYENIVVFINIYYMINNVGIWCIIYDMNFFWICKIFKILYLFIKINKIMFYIFWIKYNSNLGLRNRKFDI